MFNIIFRKQEHGDLLFYQLIEFSITFPAIYGIQKVRQTNSTYTFYYNNEELEIVRKFTYLGIVFSPGGSFSDSQNALSGQTLKAIFQMNNIYTNLLTTQSDTDLIFLTSQYHLFLILQARCGDLFNVPLLKECIYSFANDFQG